MAWVRDARGGEHGSDFLQHSHIREYFAQIAQAQRAGAQALADGAVDIRA
jgi:hypothetical protein